MKTSQEQSEKNFCNALRTTESSNRCLLTQADRKAQILIQVNGLLTSVLLVLSVYLAPGNRWFLLPVGIQLLSSLIVISSSLLAAKPRFFQSHAITYLADSQKSGTRQPIAKPSVYWNLLRDSHHQATVLAAKYKYLRISYHAFLVGLCLSLPSTLLVVILAR